MKATITDRIGQRVEVELIQDKNGRWRWVTVEDGEDTEVSSPTREGAEMEARMAWSGPVWNLVMES